MLDGPWGSWTTCFTAVPCFVSSQLSVSTERQSKGQPMVASTSSGTVSRPNNNFMELVCEDWQHFVC